MLGERLAELRKLNDDTQQTLADKLGISVWSIRAWEQGKSFPLQQCAACHLQALRHLRRLPARPDRHRPLGRGS